MASCSDVYVFNTHQLEKSVYLLTINGSFTFKSSEKEKHFSKFTYDVKFELKKIIPGGRVERGRALFNTQVDANRK